METPVSLLERVRQPSDQDAWARFVGLYTPLLFAWASRLGTREMETADLVQEVLLLLVRKLPEFHYDRHRSFRAWLRTVAHNHWRNLHRRAAPAPAPQTDLNAIAVPGEAEAFWEAEYHRHLVAQALRLMQTEFQPATWQACWASIVEGKSAAEVAAELDLTPGAVYVAKSRVLSRLRHELAGLLE